MSAMSDLALSHRRDREAGKPTGSDLLARGLVLIGRWAEMGTAEPSMGRYGMSLAALYAEGQAAGRIIRGASPGHCYGAGLTHGYATAIVAANMAPGLFLPTER